MASPESGRLDHLSVTRGETVAVSQPLFALDAEPEAAAMRQAQRVLRSSRAKLADLETGKRPEEVDVTRAQLEQAISEKSRHRPFFRATRRSIVPAELRRRI